MTNIQLFTIVFIPGAMLLTALFSGGIRRLFARKWVGIAFGAVALAYLIGVRYIPTLYYGFAPGYANYYVPKWQSLFLTDICPMFAFLLAFAQAFNLRAMVKAVAPIAMLGGLIVMFGQFIPAGDDQPDLANAVFYDYIAQSDYFGGPVVHNFGYFPTHAIMLLSSGVCMAAYVERTWRDVFAGSVAFVFYYFYVAVIMAAFNLEYNVSGLTKVDWTYGTQNELGITGEYAPTQRFLSDDWRVNLGVLAPAAVACYFIICAFGWWRARYFAERKLAVMRLQAAFASAAAF